MNNYTIQNSRPIELMPIRDTMFVHLTIDESDREVTRRILGWARIESWNEDEDGYVQNGSERITIEPLFTLGGCSNLMWPTSLRNAKEKIGEYWNVAIMENGRGN